MKNLSLVLVFQVLMLNCVRVNKSLRLRQLPRELINHKRMSQNEKNIFKLI